MRLIAGAAAACAAGDRIDPRDERIDVRAKFALARMRDRNPALRADAIRMICAVNTGRVAGIYGDDLQRAAALAARRGVVRWHLVPATQDAALVEDPATPQGPPTVIFRGDTPDISTTPLRLDTALARVSRAIQGRPSAAPPREERVALIRHPLLHYLWSRGGDPQRRTTALGIRDRVDDGELSAEDCINFDDNRTAVFASLTVPFRFVCSIGAEFSAGAGGTQTATGTGTLISPRHVLTAGHVAAMLNPRGDSHWQFGADASRMVVVPARNHAATAAPNRRPLGLLEVEGITLSSHLQEARRRGRAITHAELVQFDYAVLTLKTSVDPKTYGFWGRFGTAIREIAARELPNRPIRLSGYPGEKCRLLPPRGSATRGMLRQCFERTSPPGCTDAVLCQLLSDVASTQWQTPGVVLSSPAGDIDAPLAFKIEASVCRGMSGSPIWISHQGQHLLAGIWPAFVPQLPLAFGTRAHAAMLADLRASLRRDGVPPHF